MKRALWLLPLLLMACSALPPRDDRHGLFEIEGAPVPAVSSLTPGVAGGDGLSCSPLTDSDRERLLEVASPENFPATRYRKGSRRSLEKETDCSHFVYEVYRRAGLPFGFRATHDLKNAQEFQLLPEGAARPGDLMLFRGHVGIVDRDGRIISALVTRHRRRKSSIMATERTHFRTFRGKRFVLRYRCHPPVIDRAMASMPYPEQEKP